MAKFANEVRVELAQPADPSTDNTIVVQALSSEPNSLPLNPGGAVAPLTLMDGWYGWTKTERVTYTGRTDNGDGTYTLTGVSWAQEGTSSPSGGWSTGDFVVQDVPASWFDQVESDLAGKAAVGHGHAWGDISNPPAEATRWPAWAEVTSKPSVFPPEAHTHGLGDITDSGDLAALDVVSVTNMDSGLEASGRVMKADGSGGVAWADEGGVGSHDLEFHDNVVNELIVDGFLFWDNIDGKWEGRDILPEDLLPTTFNFDLTLNGVLTASLANGFVNISDAGGSDVGFNLYQSTGDFEWAFRTNDTSEGFAITKLGSAGGEFLFSGTDPLDWTTAYMEIGDSIKLASAGDSYFNGGNFGIGTSSPEDIFHVAADTSSLIPIFQNTRTGGGIVAFRLKNEHGYWDWRNSSFDGRLQLFDSSSSTFPIIVRQGAPNNTLYLTNGGRIGMGTTAPGATLDINGTLRVRNLPTSDPGVSGELWNDGGTVRVSP